MYSLNSCAFKQTEEGPVLAPCLVPGCLLAGQGELGWMICNNRLIYIKCPDTGQTGSLKLRYSCSDYPIKETQCFQNVLSPWGLLTSATREWKHPYVLGTFFKKVCKWILPRVCSCAERLLLHICNSCRGCNGGVSCWAGFKWCHRFFIALQEGDASDVFSFGACFGEPVSKGVYCQWGRTDNQVLYTGRSFSPELEVCKNLSRTSHCFLTMW